MLLFFVHCSSLISRDSSPLIPPSFFSLDIPNLKFYYLISLSVCFFLLVRTVDLTYFLFSVVAWLSIQCLHSLPFSILLSNFWLPEPYNNHLYICFYTWTAAAFCTCLLASRKYVCLRIPYIFFSLFFFPCFFCQLFTYLQWPLQKIWYASWGLHVYMCMSVWLLSAWLVAIPSNRNFPQNWEQFTVGLDMNVSNALSTLRWMWLTRERGREREGGR